MITAFASFRTYQVFETLALLSLSIFLFHELPINHCSFSISYAQKCIVIV